MSLPRIAVDAMGGDEGVRVMVEGAALARRRHDKFQFLLVGDETRIKAALDAHPGMAGASEILHCTDVVGGDELPSRALRRAKTTSMGLAAYERGDNEIDQALERADHALYEAKRAGRDRVMLAPTRECMPRVMA